jgi:hypothetical protein
LKIIDIRFITLIARGQSLRDGAWHQSLTSPLGLLSPYALTYGAAMRFAGGTLIYVFRRRSDAAPEKTPEAAKPGGKGRPTPKRSEAQKRNRQPITAPKDRKEAYRTVRERQARDRAKAREGMARGDDKYMVKRDRGPVRRLARDYVDSRRTIASYFMFVMLAIVMVSLLPYVWAKLLGFLAIPVMLGVVLIEGFVISRKVGRLAAERFPDENRSGAGFYAAMRSMQMRRMRMPSPQVKPGQKEKV